MTRQPTIYPRIRNLPERERKPFEQWLTGQTRPMIDNEPMSEQDAYYPWDYSSWRQGKPVTD